MKRLTVILLLLFSFSYLPAQTDTASASRMMLVKLLNDRESKFGSYQASLKSKTGIFGSKTKKDILKSNEILLQIAATDNRIFNVLNKILKDRVYEKSTMNYELYDREQKVNYYMNLSDTLARQLMQAKDAADEKNGIIQNLNLFLTGLIILIIVLLVTILKKFLPFRR